jgi:predicted CXXCH cytochrome family protein
VKSPHRQHVTHSGITAAWPWLLLLLGEGILLMLAACGPRSSLLHSRGVPPRVASKNAAPPPDPVDVREIRRALTAPEAESYLGDAVCGSCHRSVAAIHARSAHSHTLRPVSVALDGPLFRRANAVKDRQNRFTYGPVIRENQCQVLAFNDRVEATLPADYEVGSGRHARSFLNRDDQNGWVVLRLSYYAHAKTWDFTAGQPPERTLATPMGIELDGPQVTACLLCHTTVVRQGSVNAGRSAGLLSDHAYPDMAATSLGVGCERCHGPGRAHVEAVARERDPAARTIGFAKAAHHTYGMEDLGRAAPAKINSLCGYCHRTPQNTDPRDPHNEMDVPRFQGVALARSACYQKSGALSCVTCHDPHANADSSLARNDAICLRCHANGKAGAGSEHSAAVVHHTLPRICPVNPRDGCTQCHMPRQTIALGPGVRYTNHWIKVWHKPDRPNAVGKAALD